MQRTLRFNTRKLSSCAPVVALVLMLSAHARASPTYPERLSELLEMPCPPPCTVCHRDTSGGFDTVVTPFGNAMVEQGGLRARATDLLDDALFELSKGPVDSDGDGTDDVRELREGSDPNRSGSEALCGPEFGCNAAPNTHWRSVATLAAVAAALILRRRVRSGARQKLKTLQ